MLTRTTLPAPLLAGFEATVEAAGYALAIGPDGVYSDNAAAVQSLYAIYPGSASELQWHRQQKFTAVSAQYASVISAGRIYTVPGDQSGAHTYQIDEVPSATRQSSQQALTAVAAEANRAINSGVAGTPWDPTGTIAFFFVDASNVHVPMTPQQAYDFAANVGRYCTNLKLNSFQLVAQISAAPTADAVDAINITTGWPSNP